MTPPRDAGPVAEEFALLLDALRGWAAALGPHGGEAAPGSASTCRLCPVCQLLALVRDARPETFDHLADAAGSLTLAVRSALESHPARAGQDRGDQHGRPRVQRIDIG